MGTILTRILFRFLPRAAILGFSFADLSSCKPTENPGVTVAFQQTLPLAAQGVVRVESSAGAISILGWDREECRVEAVKAAGNPRELEAITIAVDATAERVAVRAEVPRSSPGTTGDGPRVDFNLMVPRRASLENIVTGRGHVTIREMDGEVVATSVNGTVTADQTTGNLKLYCVNGKAVARLTALAAGRCIDLETVNGSTTLVLPADASADITARVVNGNLRCAFPLPVEPEFPAGTRIEGRLGAGGAKVNARCANGSVSIQKPNVLQSMLRTERW